MNDENTIFGIVGWPDLLEVWANRVSQLYLDNASIWENEGFPSANELVTKTPDHKGVLRLKEQYPFVDDQLVDFYKTTDGWPIWLGSYGCSISPVNDVGFLKDVYPEAYEIAIENAPITRIVNPEYNLSLSNEDISGALAVSQPDAREIVLSLKTGELCLYKFDSMSIYNNFLEFMKYRLSTMIVDLRRSLDLLKN